MDLGLDAAKKKGIKVSREPYRDTEQSIQLCLKVIDKGRRDPVLKGYAAEVLKAAGNPPTVAGRIQALTDDVQKKVVFLPDPIGTEWVQDPSVTLCLRPGLCIPSEDCDGVLVVLVCMMLLCGIPTMIVKFNYGPGIQEHVLAVGRNERGQWLYADGTIPGWRVTPVRPANVRDEKRYDPLEGATPETIGIGASWMREDGAMWTAQEQGGAVHWFREGVEIGIGAAPPPAKPPSANIGLGFSLTCSIDLFRTYVRRLSGPWAGLRADIDGCAAIAAQKTAFANDDASFKHWESYSRWPNEVLVCKLTPWGFTEDGALPYIAEGRALESKYRRWREVLKAAGCKPKAPELDVLPDSDPLSVNYKPPADSGGGGPGSADWWDKAGKAIGTAGIVLGGLYGLSLIAPVIRDTIADAHARHVARGGR